MDWWKLDEQRLAQDEEAQAAKLLAYYNTFYGSDQGRQVLFDLTNYCFADVGEPIEVLARIRLLAIIKANCGFNQDSQMAAIEAESKSI